MSVGYRIKKENTQAAGAEIRPLTTDKDVAAALRRAMSPQPNGDLIVYIEDNDKFAAIVKKYGEIAR